MDGRPNKSAHQEVAEALASILHSGLVNLRGTAGQDKEYVQIEANHLHNLPFCLARMDLGAIRYYYEQERPCYLDEMKEMGDPLGAASRVDLKHRSLRLLARRHGPAERLCL